MPERIGVAQFVLSLVLIVIAVGALWYFRARTKRAGAEAPARSARWTGVGAGVLAVFGLVMLGTSFLYTQDEGEAKALRSFTGELVGSKVEPGIGIKAPWVETVTFDTRNNVAKFSDADSGTTGNSIPFNDKAGTRGSMDVTVTYAVRPDMVEAIYKEYRTQDMFRTRLINQDIAAMVRTVPSRYTTVEVLSKREEVSANILEALEKRWERWGVTGIQVALQDIRYPEQIMERFENLTAEQTRAEEAKAATVTAEQEAKKKLVEAEGEAKANAARSKALTPEVLQQQYIEALKTAAEKGQLIITDGKTTPMINVDGAKK
ncbi:MAG: prohibitin family protein [Arthrobacter sp.]|jgi:regulator of protease activity HflC (stomatin/prohibitin superfamily)|nr:prohibitin family protein [Arthrobacter sp.]